MVVYMAYYIAQVGWPDCGEVGGTGSISLLLGCSVLGKRLGHDEVWGTLKS